MDKNKEFIRTPEQIKGDKIVTAKSKSEKQKKALQEVAKIDLNTNTGKTTPMSYEKKLLIAKEGSGYKSRIVDGKGNVIKEASPNTPDHDELVRSYKAQKAYTLQQRKQQSDVHNVQTGNADDNKAYKNRLDQTESTEMMIAKGKKSDMAEKERQKKIIAFRKRNA